MEMITKEDLILASKQKKIHRVRNFLVDHPNWSDIDKAYESDNDVKYNSASSFQLQNLQVVFDCYEGLVDRIYKVHDGRPIFAMIIVHFVSRNSNVIDDKDFLSLRNKVYKENPKKIPESMIIKDYGLDDETLELWAPNIHFDLQERFYIQGNGQTLWRIFDNSKTLTDSIIVNPGDLVYIPKGLFHSVESIGPRHSFSMAFSDDPEITSLGMV